MADRQIEIEIKGKSPLLMHRYPMEPIEAIEKKTPEEQAEISAYRDESSGNLFIPSTALLRTLVNGAAYSKGKRNASLQKPAAACFMVEPFEIDLGTQNYTIDARPVVIPSTKGRVVRFRPRIDHWTAKFTLTYDDTLLSEAQVRQIVDDSGSRVGLLDFRPERKGPFGRFFVTHWVA